jgi:hypothetical protein
VAFVTANSIDETGGGGHVHGGTLSLGKIGHERRVGREESYESSKKIAPFPATAIRTRLSVERLCAF